MKRPFWWLLGFAALLRVVYLLDYQAHSVFWDSMLLDAEVYDQLAQKIAAGDWLGGQEVYSLPPLYPYFLAVIFKSAGHGYAVVYVIQCLLGLANICLIHSIGRKVLSGRAPLIAAAMATLYGSFMFMESKLMSTTLALTLGLLLMRTLIWAAERRTLTLWATCGGLLGITALARPETLLFVPLASWWIHRLSRKPRGNASGKAGAKKPQVVIDQYALAGRNPWFAISVFVAFVIIAVAPVTLRNWVVSNDWSLSNLISSQAGITFYQSNNERANGLYVFLEREGFSGNPHVQAEEEKKIAEKAAGRPLKRSEVTRYWIGLGMAWIAGNPGNAFVLECFKLLRFLGTYEYSTEYIIYVERDSVHTLWLTCLPFALISSLAIAGILMQLKERLQPPAILLALFVASNLAVVLLFYVSSRYRMPAAPYFILFAASAVERLVEGFTSRVSAARAGAWVNAGIVAALFPLFHFQVDSRHQIQEANVHYNAGNQYFIKLDYSSAVTEYDRALAGNRANWRAWFNRGNALAALNRNQEAIESYREVLRYNKEMTAARRKIESLEGR